MMKEHGFIDSEVGQCSFCMKSNVNIFTIGRGTVELATCQNKKGITGLLKYCENCERYWIIEDGSPYSMHTYRPDHPGIETFTLFKGDRRSAKRAPSRWQSIDI